MAKDKFVRVAAIIEELSSESVLLDITAKDEVTSFTKKLNSILDIPEASKAPLAKEIVGLISSITENCLADNPDKVQDVISYGMSCLQELFSCEKTKEETAGILENAQNYLNKILGKEVSQELLLSKAQRDEMGEYISNALSRMDEIEKDVLDLEKNLEDPEKLHAVFRDFHTLKGESGLLGIVNVNIIAHQLENLLEKVRAGEISIDAEVVTFILGIIDDIKDIIKQIEKDIHTGLAVDASLVVEEIGHFFKSKKEAKAAKKAAPKFQFKPKIPEPDLSEGIEILSEFITESGDHLTNAEEALLALETSPGDSELINKIFRGFHTIKGLAGFLNLEDIKVLAHETETMMDHVRNNLLTMDSNKAGIVLQAIDGMRKLLALLHEQISNGGKLTSQYFDVTSIIHAVTEVNETVSKPATKEAEKKKLGEILLEKDIITENELLSALDEQDGITVDKKIGEILVDNKAATPAQVERGLQEQSKVIVDNTVKLSVKKLDDLIDTMGELVIIGAQVGQNPNVLNSDDTRLVKDVGQLARIIRDMQTISMSLRLVPIRPVFQKMVRLVRDLSKKAGKDIEINVSGEETEIDKNITEMLSDPLVHMIRNSVDHGIEIPDVRKKNGKPAKGHIFLNAFHKGGNIIIEIKDDGGGLNRDKILSKARERGLIKEDETPADNRIYNLIFEPGFSTADKITDISGRGVGMDVVKRNIEQLRGKVDIATELGKGATFSIKLPLTLAIIDGIILAVGSERYIVPIFSVQEFIKPNAKDITSVTGKGEVIKVYGELFHLVRLNKHFDVKYRSDNVEELTGCLVNTDYGTICVLVDELLGQQQVVIKSLGEHLKDVKGLSGATILGDGTVGLILDVNGIAELARS